VVLAELVQAQTQHPEVNPYLGMLLQTVVDEAAVHHQTKPGLVEGLAVVGLVDLAILPERELQTKEIMAAQGPLEALVLVAERGLLDWLVEAQEQILAVRVELEFLLTSRDQIFNMVAAALAPYILQPLIMERL